MNTKATTGETTKANTKEAQFLTIEAEGLLWEARLAIAQGKTGHVPVLLRAAVGKLLEAVDCHSGTVTH